ncbi:MAG: ATP-dependent helicase HrpB [Candidatus Electrothrix aestuarii]|uniref:ATP-dependent helicase HrpB n=1 Tax=Candidatus Electrothrix aestuarii TaxID=3062594 RepID=A0AAU8LTN5_9BACT|nr:ATP-dependent helicase HrpB [Candidatus Electrothrix aestuarii]
MLLPDHLPVYKILPQLEAALAEQGCAVLTAPPGSGKTTLVPLALQDAPWLQGKKILLLEPRRIAARLAAEYMSELCQKPVGQAVGYQIRFERRISVQTKVEVITEGILCRRLQQDPELNDIGLVIFDEFHERSLDSDLAFTLCLDVLSGLREDLRILVMSATMDAEAVSSLLGNGPVIKGEGQIFPVRKDFFPPLPQYASSHPDDLARSTSRAIRQVLTQEQGDLLVFLPGRGEIRRVQEQLRDLEKLIVHPLHGSLKSAEQEAALRPDPAGRQRIILATTIAETSVTIEGISAVLDSGWKRVPRFDGNSGLSRLDTVRISRASAEQRAGRAGRLGPGTCYQLWDKGVDMGLQAYDQPEIAQADLAPLVLELAHWGVTEPAQLSWLTPPPAAAFAQGKELLQRLGALDRLGKITDIGRAMAGFPLHPRLSRMLLMAGKEGRQTAIDLAALLSEADILSGHDSVDLEDRLHCLQRFRGQGRTAVQGMGGNSGACARVEQSSRQLAALLKGKSVEKKETLSVGGLLAIAWPDRVAQRRSLGSYKLVSGRGGLLHAHDPLTAAQWLVVPSLDAGRQNGRIFLAARLEQDEVEALFAEELREEDEVLWDAQAERVVARCVVRLGQVLLSEKPLPQPEPTAVQDALLAGIRSLGLESLPWSAKARQLQARLICLRSWQPEVEWPDFSEANLLADLEKWLGPYLAGLRSLKDCAGLNLEQILLARLSFQQQQALDRDAPTHWQVPSGSRITLEYRPEEPPILAVRLQEVFGLAETPAICQGRVPVLLHLLSPARRPVQITQDLRGFWESSYFAVQKEMKGRYPKHHWPDEPWAAVASAGVKRRK